MKPTLEEIRKAAAYIFHRPKEERIIVGYTGCKTYGHIAFDEFKWCDDEQCVNCMSIKKGIKESVEDFKFNLPQYRIENPISPELFCEIHNATNKDSFMRVEKMTKEEYEQKYVFRANEFMRKQISPLQMILETGDENH